MDQVFTDVVAQLEHSKSDGNFTSLPNTGRQVADVTAGQDPGRTSRTQRLLSINMGIALEDVASALVIYRRARDLGIGTELSV